MKHILSTYLFFLLHSPFSSAFYDIVNINTQPTGDEIKFCFSLDAARVQLTPEFYIADKFYLAAIDKQSNVLFLNQTPQGLTVTPWGNDSSAVVPFFTGKTSSELCIGPFPKSLAREYQLVAGLGSSLEDVLAKQYYTLFFSGDPHFPQASKPWTVMVYMVGSDLESRGHFASKDFMEMLEGSVQGHAESFNLIISTGGSTRQGWNTVKRTQIENGRQYVIEDLGVTSMANPQTLIDFVTWATRQFPAQHYALILWNHGSGTNGYGNDSSEAGGGKTMTLPELHQAYQTIRQQLGHPLDIVVYDACLMASIEVAEVTSAVAPAMAASAELEPGHGLDYDHLLENLGRSPPSQGLDFGRLVKTGYLQHTKDKGTFENSQVTYSVFDLTQLPSLTSTLKQFAIEFKNILEKTTFLSYERLSHGIIRAPGYPMKRAGRLKDLDDSHIRIDLYGVLQTVLPEFPEFKTYANELLAQLDRTIVDYEGNLTGISPSAGRVSIDIGRDKSYLTVLPEAYSFLKEGLEFYNQQKQNDQTQVSSDQCPEGLVCAAPPNWIELPTEEVLGIDTYLGQLSEDISDIYLIKSLYQQSEVTNTLKFNLNGHEACQYQLCVGHTNCENVTLTEQRGQLLADISLNGSPAILSFCQDTRNEGRWLMCSVVSQTNGIWGRDDVLYPNDMVILSTLHIQNNAVEQRTGNTLLIDESTQVTLKTNCSLSKATIFAAFYGLNGRRQFEQVCKKEGCAKAGIQLIP